MKNRLKFTFSYSKKGNIIIVYDKLKNKRVDNVHFPITFLKFNTSLENTLCRT